MKKIFLGMILAGICVHGYSDVILTGIMDGTLTGGKPKAIEIFIAGTEDLGGYEIWRSQNGDPFGAGLGSIAALNGTYSNTFVYLVKSDHVAEFHSVFGDTGYYANVIPLALVSGNGNEGYQIRDTVGDVVIDQVWLEDPTDSYRDSYWYRINGTGPDGTWLATAWGSPGNDALDGLDEAGLRAAVPFGTYALVWRGLSSDWNDLLNWMPGTAPSAYCNVFIPDTVGVFPVVTNPPSSPAECYRLLLAEGASLTVAAGKALTVFGHLQLQGPPAQGQFLLGSANSSMPSGSLLLEGATTDSIEVQRYIPHDNAWHFLSSPVVGQSIQPAFAPVPVDNSYDMYCWQEPAPQSAGWMNMRDSAGNLNPAFDILFETGKGYLAAYSPQYGGDEIKTFFGVPHSGNVEYALSHQANYWNLLGNPYTCALDWSSAGIDKSLLAGGAMYIWDQSLNGGQGAYRTHNGSIGVPEGTSPVVPSMNGFFVHSLDNGTMTIDAGSPGTLIHASQEHYKGDDPLAGESIRLKIIKEGFMDETLILLNEEATNGYDPTLDAIKLGNGLLGAPEIGSLPDGGPRLCINQVATVPISIPLSVEHGHPDTLTLAAYDFDGMDEAVGIFLEDLRTGQWQNLREQPAYTFLYEVPGTPQRFVLHLADVTSVSESEADRAPTARVTGEKICLDTMLEGKYQYRLFDMGGRLVAGGRYTSCIPVGSYPGGIYILFLYSSEKAYRIKVIL